MQKKTEIDRINGCPVNLSEKSDNDTVFVVM